MPNEPAVMSSGGVCVLQEVKPEVVKEAEVPKEVYKHDDFFDSLSCEALERLAVSEGAQEKPQVRAHPFSESLFYKVAVLWGSVCKVPCRCCVRLPPALHTVAWPFLEVSEEVSQLLHWELETPQKGPAIVCTQEVFEHSNKAADLNDTPAFPGRHGCHG